jgi:hypothetical protein
MRDDYILKKIKTNINKEINMNEKQKHRVGVLAVVSIFAVLIYNASQVKQEAELVATETETLLPATTPVQEVELPVLLNQDWEALIPDGIPLPEIAPREDIELPPLEEDLS